MSSCPWQALSPAVVVNDGSVVEVGPLPLEVVVVVMSLSVVPVAVVVVAGLVVAAVVVVAAVAVVSLSVVPVAVVVVVEPLALLQVNCLLCQEQRGAKLLH